MRRLIPLFLIILIPACKGEPESEKDVFVAETCDSLPGADRAKAAAERVSPGLRRDLTAMGLELGDPVFLRAFKEERELEVWVKNRTSNKYDKFRSYRVAAQSGTLGPKLKEGDGQVPEGFYFVRKQDMKPDSAFHLAFNIGYPNAYDRHHKRDGTFIMIHGNQVSIGCLAMTDAKIEEIYTLCDAALTGGQSFFRVHVFPFRMAEDRMKRAEGHPWNAFWRNLRQGHDWFETHRVPPDVTLKDGEYAFGPG